MSHQFQDQTYFLAHPMYVQELLLLSANRCFRVAFLISFKGNAVFGGTSGIVGVVDETALVP